MNTNLIAISGKIGSGKDLFYDYISYKEYIKISKDTIDFQHYLSHIKHQNLPKTFANKKFAYKVKQIASIILNIPIEDFERDDVKNQPLTRWTTYKVGKKLFTNYSDATHYKYTSKLIAPIGFFTPTVRNFLQMIGTDLFRNVLNPDTWCISLFNEYDPVNSKWIISDMRFPNEFDFVKNHGGITIRINRPVYQRIKNKFPNVPKENDSYVMEHVKQHDPDFYYVLTHKSETSLDSHQFDEYIDNSGSMDHFTEQIDNIWL